jgi:hypothetical protein
MRKIFLLLGVVFLSGFSFSQIKSTTYRQMGYNTPPTNAVFVKVDATENFAYKLEELPESVSTSYVEPDFLYGKTWDEVIFDTERNAEEVAYYQTAKNYFASLSPKVKSIYSVKQLWHIYYFDQGLKNQLVTIR